MIANHEAGAVTGRSCGAVGVELSTCRPTPVHVGKEGNALAHACVARRVRQLLEVKCCYTFCALYSKKTEHYRVVGQVSARLACFRSLHLHRVHGIWCFVGERPFYVLEGS